MSRKQKWQENLYVHPNAAKSSQRRRREQTHPMLALPKHPVPDKGHISNCSTSSNSNNNSSSSCSSGIGTNTSSSSSGGPISNTRKSSINCIACSTENHGDIGSCSINNSSRGAGGGIHSATSSSISCTNKVSNVISNGVGGGGGTTSIGSKGNIVSESCCNNRRDTGCSTSRTSSLGRGLQETEVGLNKRGGVLLDSISNTSSPCTSSVSSCLSPPFSQQPESSSIDDTKAREGIESGYSSLEKTRSDAEDIQTGCDPHYRQRLVMQQQLEHTLEGHMLKHGKERDETHRTHSPGREEVHRLFGRQRRRSQVLEHFESQNGVLSHSNEAYSPSSSSPIHSTLERDHEKRQSRREAQVLDHNNDTSGNTRNSASATSRRSKSLERNLVEHSSAPDLLNFKKGWMTRLGEDGKWRKHWFVLTEQTLRFYRDSIAEEAADLDGEINLSTCYDITDFPVQRNYGFQIHTKDGVFTLCAMTYGIRRNWIQAVMKNVRPAVPPDVASSTPQKTPLSSAPGPKEHSSSNASCSAVEKRSRISERRKEGRYKTFDWAEFRQRQQKREELNRQYQTASEAACLPPAPASSPEEPVTGVLNEEPSERGRPYHHERKLHLRASQMAISNDTPTSSPANTDVSISVACEQNGQKRVVDGDISKMQVETMSEEEKRESISISPESFPSSSVQTEWDWEEELQTLRSELKAEQERSEREVRELQFSEAHLQTELKSGQDRLNEMESRLQSAEATLREKDDALEELHSHLEDVTGRLKATEEAQALKDVRIERHLRLLQESQERERRSLSDSLEHAEKRGKELEEQLQQMEAELKKTPVVGAAPELERRCQELQNQLEESDSEVGRLQARLRNEETLYYNIEHDYEQVCEELECARGALQNCERMCEEHFKAQLEQQQREINRKEQELQEVLVKMAALGTSLEETERRLKEAQSHLQKVNVSQEDAAGEQGLLGTLDIVEKYKKIGFNGTEMQAVAPRDESERVISVIQALESKLCNTEDRLREITMHLQRQQQVRAFNGESPWNMRKSTESLNTEVTFDNLDVSQCNQALHCLQGIMQERTATNSNSKEVTNGMFDFQDDFEEASESQQRQLSLSMASRILSLETLVIQRMASAVERPSRELLQKLSELQVLAQALSESQDGSEKKEAGNLSQFVSSFQELDYTSGFTLGQIEICNLCVRAELAYLIYTLHTRTSEEQQGSDTINLSPWPVPEVTAPGTRREMGPKPNFKLADIYPPELAPYSEQIQNSQEEEFCAGDMELECKGYKSLAAELRLQAESLQALSVQLQPEDGDVDLPEFSPAILQTILYRATLAYVTSRLRLALQQEICILREQRERAMCECRAVCRSMEALFQEQTERYEEKLREGRVVVEMAELGRVSAETDAQMRGQEVQRLETEFEEKLQELQKIHEEEMTRLHGYYTQSRSQAMTPSDSSDVDENVRGSALKERIRELEAQVSSLEDELRSGDANSLRQAYEQELETLKATCELGFSSMEQSHQRVIEEMQRQHQIEVDHLTEEREKVLQEETNATIAAIEAMRKAHKDELEKSQKAQQSGASTDISKLRVQFDEELESLHRELEVLSEQYSQKCLENAHLSRKIEIERQALSCTERENQELNIRNQELNKRLVAELSLMQSYVNGEVNHAQLPLGKDIYQLEVTLRVKESEIQCLRQEISSLKEELQAANRQSKELLKELSVLGAKSPSDSTKRRAESYSIQGYTYDLMKSRSNPEFMRERSKRKQAARSKSLRDGLSAQERIKLFESD